MIGHEALTVARIRRFPQCVAFCSQLVLGDATQHLAQPNNALAQLLEGAAPAQFRFIKRLGKKKSGQGFYGACSAVYLCEFKGQLFVLKLMINVYDLATVALEKEFENEFAILQAFGRDLQRSPHIVELLYTATGPVPAGLPDWDLDVQFRITQFVALPFHSENLQQLITRRKHSRAGPPPFFSDDEVMQVHRGLADAVRYLQSRRIVHRDMKPDNVLVSQCGGYLVPVLTDFGMALDCVANDFDEFLMPYAFAGVPLGGAPPFLPPEIRFARPGRNAMLDYSKSDQFGVGLILWSMLAPVNAPTLPYAERDTGYIPLPANHCSPATQHLIMSLTAPFAERVRF